MIDEKNLVVQGNPLIEAQYKLGEAEQKLLRVIISMIQPDTPDLEKRLYRFSIQDFAVFLGRTKDHDIHQQMRRMAHNLKSSNITISLPNGDTIKTSWIAAYRYPKNKGWIEFEVSWMLEEQLLKLKEQFTRYYLANISKLKGEHTVRIYELVQQYANSSLRSREISLESLRKMLDLQEEYKRPFNLFQRIIKPAHKEINAKTDISFSYRPIKESRKVVAVEFYDIQKKTVIPPSILSLIPSQYRESKDVLKNISQHLSLHGPEYVTEKLQYVNSRKDVTSYPDYLYSMLENNHGEGYKPAPEVSKVIDFPMGTVFEFGGKRYTFDGNGLRISETNVLKPEEIGNAIKMGLLSIVSKEKLQREQMEELTKKFEEYRLQKVEAYISALSEQERADLEARFVAQELNGLTREMYLSRGMASVAIKALFSEFVVRNFFPEMTLGNFARKGE